MARKTFISFIELFRELVILEESDVKVISPEHNSVESFFTCEVTVLILSDISL